MGGKTATSTSQVSIPPEVMARYNAINARAERVAETPFQQYSTDPNAFVAPLNQVQNQATGMIANAGNAGQGYFNQAGSLTGAGAGAANPGELDIAKYYNPFTSMVADNVYQALRQQQQEEMAGQTANAIKSGAFGSDRAGIAAGNLARQQQLGLAGAMLPIYQGGFDKALSTAQQQQGVELSAEQQNLARQLQAGQQFAGLGSTATGTGLQAGQALLGAGTLGQQTEQGGLSALYNQFQQERGYPFQVAQFLANIGMGTGALSGSTTTTTQPAPFFSDRRLKHSVRRIGETDDGMPIYKFKYKGDDKEQTHIGLMADEVEARHPEAVGLAGGYKTVDYDAATKAAGGSVGFDQDAIQRILANQAGMYSSMYGQPGAPGGGGAPGGKTWVPQGNLPVGKLAVASPPQQSNKSGLAAAAETGSQIAGLASLGKKVYDSNTGGKGVSGLIASGPAADTSTGPLNLTGRERGLEEDIAQIGDYTGRASGGAVDDDAPQGLYAHTGSGLMIPDELNKYELKTADPPKQQQGSGLGEILGLAKTAAMFAGFAEGGSVEEEERKKFSERALPPSPTLGSMSDGTTGGLAGPSEFGALPPVISPNLKLRNDGSVVDPANPPPRALAYSPEPSPAPRAPRISAPPPGSASAVAMGQPMPAPQPVTPGLAGPGYPADTPRSSPFKTLFGGAFEGRGIAPDKLDALKSENLWIPALAGLGSMLASRSPYLGNAVGEGLVGGTKAYTDLQGAQQNQAESRMRVEQSAAEIAKGSLFTQDGRLYLRYTKPGGGFGIISAAALAGKSPQELAAMGVDPREAANAVAEARAKGELPAQERPPLAGPQGVDPGFQGPPAGEAPVEARSLPPPASSAPAPTAGAAGIVPPASPIKRPTAIGGISLQPEEVNLAGQLIRERSAYGQEARGKLPDLFTPQIGVARESENTRQLILPLAGALASLPREKSAITSGPMQSVMQPLVSTINNLAAMAGIKERMGSPKDGAAFQEEILKLTNQMQTQTATAAQQRAFGALQEMAKGIPGILNSPEAQAKLIPQMLTNTQREIDRNNYYQMWKNAASTRPDLAERAWMVSDEAEQKFNQRFNEAYYQAERQKLEQMFNNKVNNGQSELAVVAQNAANLSPKAKQYLAEKYGSSVLRYFGITP